MFDNLKIGDKVVTIDIISRKGNIVGEIVNINPITKFRYNIKVLSLTEDCPDMTRNYVQKYIGSEETIVRSVDEITSIIA
jgi:hypothetical protein